MPQAKERHEKGRSLPSADKIRPCTRISRAWPFGVDSALRLPRCLRAEIPFGRGPQTGCQVTRREGRLNLYSCIRESRCARTGKRPPLQAACHHTRQHVHAAERHGQKPLARTRWREGLGLRRRCRRVPSRLPEVTAAFAARDEGCTAHRTSTCGRVYS